MAHYKISNRVSHLLIFYLLVFDRIHDAMYLNKMSRTSSRNIVWQKLKSAKPVVRTVKRWSVEAENLLIGVFLRLQLLIWMSSLTP